MSDFAQYVLIAFGLVVIIFIGIAIDYANQPLVDDSLAHWHLTIPGLVIPPGNFYEKLSLAVRRHKLDQELSFDRVELYERNIISGKRLYFRVRRDRLSFYIFAAPIGKSVFISSWFIYQHSLFARVLMNLPLIGSLFTRLIRLAESKTFYTYDAALHFMEIIHGTLLEVVDTLVAADNLQPIEGDARKPIMRELYAQPVAPRLAL